MKFAPTFWRRLVVALAGCLLLMGGQPPSARAEGLLQLFNVSWSEITKKMPELAEAGYGSLWLPPPTKGSGGLSVGYDMWDPFDLGSKDQRNSVRTRYGTEAELLEMIETAHRFGLRVYFDNIMNHRAFDVPGYDENTPIDVYPGMVPEDFHLRKTEDGFYRKWDNTRDWGSAWQVQNLGLADLIDIAHETPNANHGTSEGSTHPKYSFIRDFDRPEHYDTDKDGQQAYFGVLIDQARAA
ncbi:MAG: alpha-amylase family glycosyl hydrolase, partial [Chthoniobacterales bacterium]